MKQERDWALQKLRIANAVLWRMSGLRPAGYRCALADRGGGAEPSAELLDWSWGCLFVIAQIEDVKTRRIINYSMMTVDGEAAYTQASIARMLGIGERTVQRKLSDGLDFVARKLRLAPRHYGVKACHAMY